MNAISSDCDALMRAPNKRSSLFVVCESISAGHFNGLCVMHDHALHELNIFRRSRR